MSNRMFLTRKEYSESVVTPARDVDVLERPTGRFARILGVVTFARPERLRVGHAKRRAAILAKTGASRVSAAAISTKLHRTPLRLNAASEQTRVRDTERPRNAILSSKARRRQTRQDKKMNYSASSSAVNSSTGKSSSGSSGALSESLTAPGPSRGNASLASIF